MEASGGHWTLAAVVTCSCEPLIWSWELNLGPAESSYCVYLLSHLSSPYENGYFYLTCVSVYLHGYVGACGDQSWKWALWLLRLQLMNHLNAAVFLDSLQRSTFQSLKGSCTRTIFFV